jgi:pimeloyl-ACP methyl ester carboxylesterase
MPGLLAACRADVALGCGTEDQFVRPDQLLVLDRSAVVLDGIGHNPHVEAPERVAELVLGFSS